MTGAGLSQWAGYPVWSELLRRLEQRVEEVRGNQVVIPEIRRQYGHSPLLYAGVLGRELGREFERFLRVQFGRGGGAVLSPVLVQFASLPLRQHLTLNFDDSLERSHGAGTTCQSVSAADKEALLEFLESCEDPAYGKRAVHFHGLFSDPLDSLVLTEDGYRRFYNDLAFYRRVYWTLFATRSVLFVGFGFMDEDFLNALQEWRRDSIAREADLMHFAIYGLQPGGDDVAIRARLASEYRIDCLFYEVQPEHDHCEFAALVSALNAELGTINLQRQVIAAAGDAALAATDAARVEELTRTMLLRTDGGLANV